MEKWEKRKIEKKSLRSLSELPRSRANRRESNWPRRCFAQLIRNKCAPSAERDFRVFGAFGAFGVIDHAGFRLTRALEE